MHVRITVNRRLLKSPRYFIFTIHSTHVSVRVGIRSLDRLEPEYFGADQFLDHRRRSLKSRHDNVKRAPRAPRRCPIAIFPWEISAERPSVPPSRSEE